jgi:hypothetical protein
VEFFQEVCGKISYFWPAIVWLILEILGLILTIFLTVKSIQLQKGKLVRSLILVGFLGGYIYFFLFTSLVTFIFFSIFYDSNMGKYYVVNAAIKNTCLLDTQQIHCPRNWQEVLAIEDKTLVPLTQDTNITLYDFRPWENQYTVVIREGNSAIVFDPRLLKTELGNDSATFSVESCGKNHSFIKPPPISGPWDSIN